MLKRWSSFLPPLHNFKVDRIQNIIVEFERLLNQAIINDDTRTQFGYLSALYGKLCSYYLAIIEAVQRAVNKEPLILKQWTVFHFWKMPVVMRVVLIQKIISLTKKVL